MTSSPPVIKRILIPTDYSECADYALAWGVLHARTFGADLTVIHVVPRLKHFSAFGYTDNPDNNEVTKDQERLAAHVKARLGDSGLEVKTLVETGDAAFKIREAAAREKIDLIIMGTHGVSRLEDLLFGSVTEKVVHHTGCPVLAVPPPVEVE